MKPEAHVNAEKTSAAPNSELYEILFRRVNDAILIFEPETEIILEVSDKACEIYRRRREDFVGHSLKEFSQNVPRGSEELEKLLHDGAYDEFESVHLRGDGVPINLIINAAVIVYRGRQAILTINRDVTEKKLTETALRESEEQFSSVANSAQDAIISADNRGNIIFWNEAAQKMFGYRSEEAVGQSLQLIMPAAHRRAHQNGLERNVETGKNRLIGKTVEVPGRRKDGSEFSLELSLGSWESEKGKFFTAVLRDITDRKEAEDKLRRREANLAAAQRLTHLGSWEIELSDFRRIQNNKVRWSDEIYRIFGGEPGTFIVTFEYFFAAVHPDDRRFVRRAFLEAVSYRKDLDIEYRVVLPDGAERVQHGLGEVVYDEKTNQPVKFVGTLQDITARKRAEEKILALAAIVESSHDAIIGKNLDGTITSWNNGAKLIFGYEPEEVIGKHISLLFPPERLPEEEKIISAIKAGRSIENFETVRVRKNGAPIPVSLTISPIKNAAGEIVGVSKIAHDISERKRAEAETSKLAAIVESSSDAIISKDLDGTVSSWNRGAEKIFGYAAAEAVGRHISFLFPPERLSEETIIIEKLKRGETIEQFETVRVRKGGEQIPVSITVSPIKNAGGETVGISKIAHDITARKRAEEQMRDSETRYRLLFESNPNPILIYERETLRILAVNEEAVRHYGYTRDEFTTLTLADIRPEDQIAELKKLAAQADTGVQRFASVKHRKKDGTIIEVEIAAQNITIDGKAARLSVVTDVTERRRAELSLLESEDRFRSFMNNNPAVAFMKDDEGRYVFINETMERAFDLTAREFFGKTDFDWLPEKAARELRRNDENILESDRSVQVLEVVPLPDGSPHSFLSFKFPVTDASGKKFLGGVAIDVTEREQAQAALRESEYKLRTLLDSMSEGLVQVSNDEVIEFVNDRFCEMTGFCQDDLHGKITLDVLFDKEGRKFVREANRQRLKGESSQYELRLKKKNGEFLYVIVGGVPIVNAEGCITGTMGVFTDITERKRAEQQLLHDAFHDGLTGLSNRALFMDHLQRAIERGKSRHSNFYAVLFLDFDRFKVVNDSLGHYEGDNFLKIAARRLEHSTRTGDVVARLGGDEFVVLLSELAEAGDAVQIAERILEDLKMPFEIGGREIFISASIGIALSTGEHLKAEDMLKNADIAMYRAKAKGRARYQVFDAVMGKQAAKLLSLDTEMRHALERGEFELHYQPIINLETDRLTGFESLVRWRHPTRGMIPPFEFIPAAEESNLILPLGKWILEESCRQLREWQEKHPPAADLTVSVNLSPKQFAQADLIGQIADALKRTKLDAGCLKLEITESHIMENSEQAIATMKELRALGVEISLDDFGTGYSSLNYLHRLPASFLKIDRSFVIRMLENEENSEIVSTIIKLAQNLKMKTVAEGIETEEQLAHLKRLNCEFGQGYFFSKPLDAKTAADFIERATQFLPLAPDERIINSDRNARPS